MLVCRWISGDDGDDLLVGSKTELESKKKLKAVAEIIYFGSGEKEELGIGVLSTCQQSPIALQFARYLAAPKKGNYVLAKSGMSVIPGDKMGGETRANSIQRRSKQTSG